MDLRYIFDRSTVDCMVEGGGLNETALTRRTVRHAKLPYGEINYVRGPEKESLWAHHHHESRIDVLAEGKVIVQVPAEARDKYLRRWLRRKSPLKPAIAEDGSIIDVMQADQDEVVAFIRATYCGGED